MPQAIQDILETATRLRTHIEVTPVRQYAALNEWVGHGIQVYVKHENHLPTGSFKIRNALAAVWSIPDEMTKNGLVTASMGNHGLGVAWAGASKNIPVRVYVPEKNSLTKNKAIVGLGAELIETGETYQDAVTAAQRHSAERGAVFVSGVSNRWVIAGAGTLTLEFIHQIPDLDTIIYAVGGGSQSAGGSIVLREYAPWVEAICVQAENAAGVYRSWYHSKPNTWRPRPTLADGLATHGTSSETLDLMRGVVSDFVLVNENEIAAAMISYIEFTQNIAEGAGAAGLAALYQLRRRLTGKKVGIILSGSNVDISVLKNILVL